MEATEVTEVPETLEMKNDTSEMKNDMPEMKNDTPEMYHHIVIEISEINCCICLESLESNKKTNEKYKMDCCHNEIHKSCLKTLVKYQIKKSKMQELISIECPLCRNMFIHVKHQVNANLNMNNMNIIMKKCLILLFCIVTFGPFLYWMVSSIIEQNKSN